VTALGPGVATIVASSDSAAASVRIAVCADLAVGEAVALDPAATSHCFAGAESATEYVYIPVNTGGSGRSLTITASGIGAVTGPPSPALLPESYSAVSPLRATFTSSLESDPHLARL